MSDLLDFQDAFVAALGGAPSVLSPWLPSHEADPPGLAVYRNTIAKGCVDALAANFPTVASLVGDDWFRAAAALFAREAPPASAALLDYGEAFPAWLDRFPPARDLPYLAGVAHLDRLWIEALFAAEAPSLGADAFAELAPQALAAARVALHPSVRFALFEAGLPSLWAGAREGRDDLELSEAAQGLLVSRSGASVAYRVVGPADCAFLAACAAGDALAEAMGQAAQADPDANLQALFAALIADGVFGGLISGSNP
ncbi:putative DNA-binding domain-containing protein [Caulobacter sp. ErkDOM-YI]|uniref:HvfC/BufC family peptide modification chaperone n=1 Tax=unclassified Caulobacter TaxID=2648921 RepID=UPI003AF96562